MKKDNHIITDQNDNIVFLGDGTLKYIRRDLVKPVAYPSGSFEKGNVLIYICNSGRDYSFISKEFKIDYNEIHCDRRLLVISAIFSEEIRPIIKQDFKCEGKNEELIDTIYERKSVSVIRKGKNITVRVDAQKMSFDTSKYKEIAILIDDNGIKYFIPKDMEENGFEKTLRKKDFNGYCDQESIQNINLKKLIHNNIYEAILRGAILTDFKDAKVFISKETIELKGILYNLISFDEEDSLIQNIIDDNLKYNKILSKESEDKYGSMQYNSFRLWGNEGKFRELEKLLQKGSATNATILLTGESGTGKTFLAREIHKCSKRKDKPFVHINYAAIAYHLLESELFGYEEGAFTGAKKGGKEGLFDMAFGGTLFLDEIGEIPLTLQGKLLEVMQSKTYYRVGGTKKRKADVRCIAATNKNLAEMVKEKSFREDLYYRINVFPIEIPPLRERLDCIHALISDILPEICERLEIEPVLIGYQTMEKIKEYPWPGNIRELENVLEKAAILCDEKVIPPDDIILPEHDQFALKPMTLKELKENCEKQAIRNALNLFHGDKIKAAQYLDIGRTAIFDKIKKYAIIYEGIEENDFR
ncbi:transcriptional regulator with PAS, ATPase and Fis domain [Sedimentibacter acidaminivorans]|uniref:Transcriptional regulator with PAS, ATPase and Fis domain n=1 Tax=Sedimentibacter acidaminivorans TaxID=913099 RepID=A0ABS4G9R1_9FIRM|nr:sigma-54 dependent transcriptional regulator [Sedimentibacter acidaminivorans]MBP1924282.1 transcriptional regulator with PAS, ATPase and Fis domain [Sedimentibacter acidaminivorans]